MSSFIKRVGRRLAGPVAQRQDARFDLVLRQLEEIKAAQSALVDHLDALGYAVARLEAQIKALGGGDGNSAPSDTLSR